MMVLTGPCYKVFWCPYCGEYYGGVACGGVIKMCCWCKIHDCDKREMEIVERHCRSESCIFEMVLGFDPKRLNLEKPK